MKPRSQFLPIDRNTLPTSFSLEKEAHSLQGAKLRHTELGTEKQCPECREFWPLDEDFFGVAQNLRARLTQHAMGQGARLMEVITNAGIEWRLARTWSGDRAFERYLKNYKRAPRLCPICSGKAAFQRATQSSQQSLPSKDA